jgi:hypothetical protein
MGSKVIMDSQTSEVGESLVPVTSGPEAMCDNTPVLNINIIRRSIYNLLNFSKFQNFP